MKKLLLAVALTAISAQAFAGGYVAASIGQSRMDAEPLDNDVAFKLAGGYMVNENFGAEVGYARTSASGSDFGADVDLTVDTIYVAAVGQVPLGNGFGVHGKLGLAHNSADAEISFNGMTDSASDSDTEVMFGAGVSYAVSKQFTITAEYDRFEDSIEMLSMGVRLAF